MANVGIREIIQRAMDLNLRYYGAVGQLTADYVQDLIVSIGDAKRLTIDGVRSRAPGPPSPPTPEPSRPIMVLEAETGNSALGVFLVENQLPKEVHAQVIASAFTDSLGRSVQPALIFDPASVILGPKEQALMRVSAMITNELEPGVRYQGELTIPALRGTRIPIVLRRRSSSSAAGTGAASITDARD
jgi:hypothetical protein